MGSGLTNKATDLLDKPRAIMAIHTLSYSIHTGSKNDRNVFFCFMFIEISAHAKKIPSFIFMHYMSFLGVG